MTPYDGSFIIWEMTSSSYICSSSDRVVKDRLRPR